MKKNILIFSHAMEIGGAERALLGLLGSIDYNKCNIDLFLMRHSGELMNLIPKEVNLLPENKKYASLAVPITQVIKNKNFSIALGRVLGKYKAELYAKSNKLNECYASIEYSHKYTKAFMPKISDKTYDLAISFLTPHYFVTEKIDAKKKIAWIHTDYQYINVDVESELKMWSAYNHIISISDDVTRSFLSKFPTLKDKIVKIENISPKSFIISQSEITDAKNKIGNTAGTTLLSIGRFCEQKNFDNVPEICSLIKQKGIDVKWYLIGFGGDEELIKSKIREFHMEDSVIILGKKDNPYPYIKACDIYVQPSRYEGKAVTVSEALILNKPVVITNYATAHSQLTDGVDGIIAPLDNQGCADKTAELIMDKDLQNKLIENTKANDYSNEKEIEKLYKLIEG